MGALIEAMKKQADKVPPSFKTVQEWADDESMGEDRARKIIKDAVKSDHWEEKVFRVFTGTCIQPVKYYRPVPKK